MKQLGESEIKSSQTIWFILCVICG
jgi:hypothetical protein